ncbi:MAG: hypothetical protein U5K37_01765 [Natrialbaceae archaeon]|nr:hypothetical protein [Natrialbaceae archaeon]
MSEDIAAFEEQIETLETNLEAAETEADLDDIEADLEGLREDIEPEQEAFEPDEPEDDDEELENPDDPLVEALDSIADGIEDQRGPYANDVITELQTVIDTVAETRWTADGASELVGPVDRFLILAGIRLPRIWRWRRTTHRQPTSLRPSRRPSMLWRPLISIRTSTPTRLPPSSRLSKPCPMRSMPPRAGATSRFASSSAVMGSMMSSITSRTFHRS